MVQQKLLLLKTGMEIRESCVLKFNGEYSKFENLDDLTLLFCVSRKTIRLIRRTTCDAVKRAHTLPLKHKSVQLTRAARFCLLFIICILIGITSLPQNQHPAHYRHALYYPEHRLVALHSYQDQLVHHPEHHSGHTFQHLQPGMPYSVRPWQNLR